MANNHLLASTNDARTTLSAAIAYARAGFRPTPTVCGRPRVRGWQVERFLESEEDVRAAWRRDDDGVGLLMGQCSLGDLVAIVATAEEGRLSTLQNLTERCGRPPTTLTGSTSAGDLQLVYRVVVPRDSSQRLARAFGRSSDPRPTGNDGSPPASLIRNRGDAESIARGMRWSLPGLDVRVRGEQIPVACGYGEVSGGNGGGRSGAGANGVGRPRWTRPMLPAELPAEWYEMLVEATNR